MANLGHRLLTSHQPCPYILGNTETLFHIVQPNETNQNNLKLHDALCETVWENFGEHGFRRQGRHIYRPTCNGCEACVAARVVVSEFEYTRRFRRTLRRNADIEVVQSREPLISDKEAFKLYASYIESRHPDGAMYPPDIRTMRSMLYLEPDRDDFHLYGFLDNEVVFIAQTDKINNGLSANYTIFNTELDERSLGTFSILKQIEICRSLDQKYLYLGYIIEAVENMAYKRDFLPQERFTDGVWCKFKRIKGTKA